MLKTATAHTIKMDEPVVSYINRGERKRERKRERGGRDDRRERVRDSCAMQVSRMS